jgi:hypothetical protein
MKIVVNRENRNIGIFIPVESFDDVRPSVKAGSVLDKLMDELTEPEEMRRMRNQPAAVNDLSVKDSETLQQYKLENFYIETFRAGKPVYYKDKRCVAPSNIIRADADGSETLINYDWESNMETEIRRLAGKGAGKFAYLLHDPRFLNP